MGLLLALVAATAAGLTFWNLERARALRQADERVAGLKAQLDSLRAQRTTDAARAAEYDQRIAAVEARARRAWGAVRPAEVAAVRSWISRLENRLAGNESRLEALTSEVHRRILATQDSANASLSAMRRLMDERFAEATHGRARLADRLDSLTHAGR